VPWAANYCLDAGRYAAELFLNGTLVGSASVDVDTLPLSVIRSRELDLIGCVPATWERYGGKSQEWRPDTPARTFVLKSDGRTSFGSIIATYFAPGGLPESLRSDYFLRRTVRLLFKKDRSDTQWSQDAEDRLIAGAVDVDRIGADCESDQTIGGVLYRLIRDPADENVIHVAMVNANGPANRACPVLKSLTNYFDE
jgi:hypothetical protein